MIKHDVIEKLGTLNDSESWTISVDRASWNDQPAKIDIRRMNKEKGIYGKGVSISDQETDVLVNILVSQGFGDTEEIIKAVKERDSNSMYEYTELELFEEALNNQGVDIYIPEVMQ